MENIEFFQDELSLAGEIAVSHKNNILTDRISLQISGRKQISAQPVVNGTTVQCVVCPIGPANQLIVLLIDGFQDLIGGPRCIFDSYE